MRFTDKVVVVLGGNSGIGLAAAKAFAAEGGLVRITGRDPETLVEAEAQIHGARSFRADIADLAAMHEVYESIGEADGRIDVLFINAGVGGFAPLRGITDFHSYQQSKRSPLMSSELAFPGRCRRNAINALSTLAGATPRWMSEMM